MLQLNGIQQLDDVMSKESNITPLEEAISKLNIGEIYLFDSNIMNSTEMLSAIDIPYVAEYYRRPVRRETAEIEGEHENSFPKFRYRYIFATGVRIKKTTESEEPLLSIEAKFRAEYYSNESVSDSALDAFSKDHIAYHIWPFWREYAQSSCIRLGISPIEIPLYRIQNNDK